MKLEGSAPKRLVASSVPAVNLLSTEKTAIRVSIASKNLKTKPYLLKLIVTSYPREISVEVIQVSEFNLGVVKLTPKTTQTEIALAYIIDSRFFISDHQHLGSRDCFLFYFFKAQRLFRACRRKG